MKNLNFWCRGVAACSILCGYGMASSFKAAEISSGIVEPLTFSCQDLVKFSPNANNKNIGIINSINSDCSSNCLKNPKKLNCHTYTIDSPYTNNNTNNNFPSGFNQKNNSTPFSESENASKYDKYRESRIASNNRNTPYKGTVTLLNEGVSNFERHSALKDQYRALKDKFSKMPRTLKTVIQGKKNYSSSKTDIRQKQTEFISNMTTAKNSNMTKTSDMTRCKSAMQNNFSTSKEIKMKIGEQFIRQGVIRARAEKNSNSTEKVLLVRKCVRKLTVQFYDIDRDKLKTVIEQSKSPNKVDCYNIACSEPARCGNFMKNNLAGEQSNMEVTNGFSTNQINLINAIKNANISDLGSSETHKDKESSGRLSGIDSNGIKSVRIQEKQILECLQVKTPRDNAEHNTTKEYCILKYAQLIEALQAYKARKDKEKTARETARAIKKSLMSWYKNLSCSEDKKQVQLAEKLNKILFVAGCKSIFLKAKGKDNDTPVNFLTKIELLKLFVFDDDTKAFTRSFIKKAFTESLTKKKMSYKEIGGKCTTN